MFIEHSNYDSKMDRHNGSLNHKVFEIAPLMAIECFKQANKMNFRQISRITCNPGGLAS